MSNSSSTNPCLAILNYEAQRQCLMQCTLATCPLSSSYWGYLPSLAANGLFLALFSISLLAFVIQAFLSKRWLGFSIAMISGGILEVLGYAGRIWAHSAPFSENPFLIEIVCLTIAPAFYAAGFYLCLRRIVMTFGAENSRLRPARYPQIFITCDFLSLILQAAGGGMASSATHTGKNPKPGNHIMLAGLAFQVFTLLIFMILSLDFAYTTLKRIRALGETGALDPRHHRLRNSFRFKAFICALIFATLCIFTRSVYRVAELSEGWNGHLIKTQKYFIGLEGAVVIAGILGLNVFHPGFCFREAYEDVTMPEIAEKGPPTPEEKEESVGHAVQH